VYEDGSEVLRMCAPRHAVQTEEEASMLQPTTLDALEMQDGIIFEQMYEDEDEQDSFASKDRFLTMPGVVFMFTTSIVAVGSLSAALVSRRSLFVSRAVQQEPLLG